MSEQDDVLIVEDDADLSALLVTILKFSKIKVKQCTDPGEVYNLVKENEPKMILSDMLLSGYDGRDICRQLKTSGEFENLKIMMMSAHPDAEVTCREAGADDFIGKPFDMDEMISRIKNLISLN